MNDGGSAFPAHENWRIDSGMSLRDYFAAKAMQGWIASVPDGQPLHHEAIAAGCYHMADAMLEARKK